MPDRRASDQKITATKVHVCGARSVPTTFANAFLYSPSADGQRFLVNTYATDSQSSLDVLINWPASLAK